MGPSEGQCFCGFGNEVSPPSYGFGSKQAPDQESIIWEMDAKMIYGCFQLWAMIHACLQPCLTRLYLKKGEQRSNKKTLTTWSSQSQLLTLVVFFLLLLPQPRTDSQITKQVAFSAYHNSDLK